MKQFRSLLSLLLAVLLLLSMQPYSAAENPPETPALIAPDFAALVQAAQAKTPGILLLSDPIYYMDTNSDPRFSGPYASYVEAGTGDCGVIDYTGRILWQPHDKSIYSITVFPCGVAMAMCKRGEEYLYLPFTVTGQQLGSELGSENIIWGEFGPKHDWDSMQPLFVCGELRDENELAPVGGFLLDAKGHCLLTEDLGLVYRGALPVKQNGVWHLCDLDGTPLISTAYEALEFLDADTLLARQNGSWQLINRSGDTIAALPGITEAESLAPETAYVKVQENGLWGLRDADGKELVPCRYSAMEQLFYGNGPANYRLCLKAQRDGQWYFLTPEGAEIPLNSYETVVSVVSSHGFIVGSYTEGYQFVDATGAPLIEERYDEYYQDPADDAFILMRYQGTGNSRTCTGIVCDSEGRQLLSFEGLTHVNMTKDAVICEKDGNTAFYSRADGTLLHRLDNTTYHTNTRDYAIVSQNGLLAMTDAKGALVTQFAYDYAYFSRLEGIACLHRDGACYLLDCLGNELTPALEAVPTLDLRDSQYAAYLSGGKYGFLKYRAADDPMFADVEAGKWYAPGADFCALTGLMNGVGGGRFAPDTVMTRAMLVRVLYNLSGSKCDSHGFVDVPEGKWYTDAVNWAAANGIVNGIDATHFAPDAPVTREQMVTILRRYAQKFSTAEGTADALAAFDDSGEVSAFAQDAMRWAVSIGLINGKTATTLVPKGQATRAEIATVLMRFVKHMAEQTPPADK